MAVPPAVGLALRIWQLVWAGVLLGTTAAIVAKTEDLLKPVVFGLATSVLAFVAAAIYIVVPRIQAARKLGNALAGVVDIALSLTLAALAVAAAATMGRSETRDVVCKVSDFVNQVTALLQQYLNISANDGGLSQLCGGVGLAIAAAAMLFVSFLATAVLGGVAARQGEGLLPLGKRTGVEGKLSQPPITV